MIATPTSTSNELLDLLVIGAGQAGPAIGYHVWKDARIATVSAGTSQIHREIICRALGLRG